MLLSHLPSTAAAAAACSARHLGPLCCSADAGPSTTGIDLGDKQAVIDSVQNYYGEVRAVHGGW